MSELLDTPFIQGTSVAFPQTIGFRLHRLRAAALLGGALFSAPHNDRPPTTLRYLLLRCEAPDAVTPTIGDAALRLFYDGPAPSFRHWVAELSEGQMIFEVAGLQRVTLPLPMSSYVVDGSFAGRIQEDCALGAVGVDWSTIDGIVLHPNWNGGGATGGATSIRLPSGLKPLRIATIPPAAADPRTITHELGHSIGWSHSGSDYGDPRDRAYDSRWDVMSGGAMVQTLAANRAAWGWIPPERHATVAPGTMREIELEITGSGRQHPRGIGGVDLLEYSTPRGDRTLTAEARIARGTYEYLLPGSGVILHRLTRPIALSHAGNLAKLIDGDGNGEANDAGTVFIPGERYEHADGIGLDVLAATADGFRVRAWSGWWLSVDARGPGTVTGVPGAVPCSGTICKSLHGAPGLQGSLIATAIAPAVFRGWTGACAGLGPCTVSLDRSNQVVAHFGTYPLLLGERVRPYAVAGRPYADTLQVDVVGPGGIQITATPLPAGLQLDAATGRISGTPSASGLSTAIVTMVGAGGTSVDTIRIAVLAPLSLVADSLFVVKDRERWFGLPPDGAGALGRDARLLSGTLPAGMGFRSDGALGGTPTGPVEVRRVTIGYTLPSGPFSATYHIVVLARMPTITTAAPPRDRWIGGSLTLPLRVEGNDPVTWRLVSGALPPGVTMTQTDVRGTFVTEGSYQFSLEARRGSLADTLVVAVDVDRPTPTTEEVMGRFLRGAALNPPVAEYLDFIGNRDGRVDVGDIRAWLTSRGIVRTGGSR